MINLAEGFTFEADSHTYRLGANVVPNCTGLLSLGGLVPFHFVDADTLERRSELGREVHRACHLHNLGRLGVCDPRVAPHVNAWMRFKSEAKGFKLISSEYQTVAWANGMPFGMTLDCNAMVDGRDTIIEYKIGNPCPHHGVQLAGYAAGAPHDKYSTPIARFMMRKRMVVELRDNGVPKVHKFDDRSDYEVFCSLLYVASWKRRHQNVYKENGQ